MHVVQLRPFCWLGDQSPSSCSQTHKVHCAEAGMDWWGVAPPLLCTKT